MQINPPNGAEVLRGRFVPAIIFMAVLNVSVFHRAHASSSDRRNGAKMLVLSASLLA